MKRKIMSCLLAVALTVTAGVPAIAGQTAGGAVTEETGAEESAAEKTDILPLDNVAAGSEDEILEARREEELAEDFDVEAYEARTFGLTVSDVTEDGKYNGYEVYTVEDAAQYCMDLLKDHKESADETFLVAVPYSVSEVGSGSPYAYAYTVYNAEFDKAFDESVGNGGGGGDYLLYSMYGKPFYVSSSCRCFTDGDDGIALVYAKPGKAVYYTSASEEKKFKEQAAAVVKQLDSGSDYDKVCAVYDYICENVEYDYDNLGNSGYYTMYTAYGALCDGKAVCQGYANLFYYLCGELGVPCRIVAGTAYNGSTSGAHAWNIVELDGTWYHVDVTWGASYSKWYSGRYFFLQSAANFANGHAGTTHTMDCMNGLRYIDYTGSAFLDAHPISPANDYHDHSYELVERKAASCGTKGYEVYACSGCGETYEETLPALTHEYEVTERMEPSCTEAGRVVEVCANCGSVKTTVLPAEGHSYEAVLTVDATCVDYGYTDYVCTVCGHEHRGDVTGSARGHRYGLTDWKKMTHEEDGYYEYTCSECGDVYVETIPCEPECSWTSPVIIHSSDSCRDDILYTCSICGAVDVEESFLHEFVEHEAVEATCTEDGCEAYEECRYCGRIRDDGTGVMTAADMVVEATGHTHGEDLGADADGNGCVLCAACGEPYHIEGDDVAVTVEPTCTEDGEKEYVCISCGMEVIEAVPAIGHKWISEVTAEADEENCAEVTYTCAVCGESYSEGGEAHVIAEIPALEPTCIDEGYTEGTRCTECGMILSGLELLEPTGHVEGGPEGFAATCTENGDTGTVHCAVCGEFLSEGTVIPATGHDIVCEPGYDPTCTEDGLSDAYYCDICGEIEEEAETIPMTGHSEVVIYEEATCTEDGVYFAYCATCGEALDEGYGIPATGHSWTVVSEAVDPSCYEDGRSALIVCENCGLVDSDNNGSAIPAGHVLTHFEYLEPTEYEDGNIEFWYCYLCDTCFLDEDAFEPVAFGQTVLTYGDAGDDGEEADGTDDAGEALQDDADGDPGDGVTGIVEDAERSALVLQGSDGSNDASQDESESGAGVSESGEESGEVTSSVSTGDDSRAVLWICVIFIAVIIVLFAILCVRRRRKNDDADDGDDEDPFGGEGFGEGPDA